MPSSIAFLCIGGAHQVYHIAPVAAAMAIDHPATEVTVLALDARSLDLARQAATAMGATRLEFALLEPSTLGGLTARLTGNRSAVKVPTLFRNRKRLDSFDAIVVSECTSTIVRRLGVRRPRLICIPHGAGDRAVSFEPRFRRFDRVLVAGAKTAERMIASGVSSERVAIVGYPKAELVRRMTGQRLSLFDNGRPTVLYNPHFRRSLSSLDTARAVTEAFAAQDRFNLILAPHIRAFENADADELAAWSGLVRPGSIHVDLGSDRLVDMSYVMAADIYLGDVSSQVYEFLLAPRPCVFLDAHGVKWQGNPDYDFWRLGEVVTPGNVMAAVARAGALHENYLALQHEAIEATFGTTTAAPERAANDIMAYIAAVHEGAGNEAAAGGFAVPAKAVSTPG